MQKESLSKILRCLSCNASDIKWEAGTETMTCQECAASYRTKGNAVIFRTDYDDVAVMPEEHESNSVHPSFKHWLETESGITLNLGAGASKQAFPNCVEAEYKVFKNTDVVADAHQLPFADNVFDFVMAMNVFEHLHSPHVAADEIFRILKPGGQVIIHTAFLQPYHEAPHHYYNATHAGVLNWFTKFHVDHCEASANFLPDNTLGFLINTILYYTEAELGKEARDKVAETTLGEWAAYWQDRKNHLEAVDVLGGMHKEVQRIFAAGFELLASKPLS